MKNWVREKLKRIAELYPEERIRLSKERWSRVWSGQEPIDRYPFVFAPVTIRYYDDVFTREEGLMAYLNEFIIRGIAEDDFIPAFFPGCRQGTLPGMFGAKEIIEGGDHTCERIIHKADDIDALPEISIMPGTPAYEWLKMQEYYLEETEGALPVHVADMQGPLDVCGQLWGYDNILSAPFFEPEYYHKLMGLATDAFILFWRKQQELLGDHFIGTHLFGWDWVPDGACASLSADSMVMLSPAFFDENLRLYLEKIGSAFGGLSVHSCGDFSGVLRNLDALPCLKAVNASQMSMQMLLEKGLGADKVIIANTGTENIDSLFNIIRAGKLRTDLTIYGLWPEQGGKVIDPANWDSAALYHIRETNRKIVDAAMH